MYQEELEEDLRWVYITRWYLKSNVLDSVITNRENTHPWGWNQVVKGWGGFVKWSKFNS